MAKCTTKQKQPERALFFTHLLTLLVVLFCSQCWAITTKIHRHADDPSLSFSLGRERTNQGNPLRFPSMEIPRKLEENPSAIDSPNNNGLLAAAAAGGGGGGIVQIQTPPLTPTTFVQADTSSFKQVVQMLTGSSETSAKQAAGRPTSDPSPSRNYTIPPIKKDQKKQGFKLYERRNSLNKMISPLIPNLVHNSAGFSPRKHLPLPMILSPSIIDLTSLTLSPVTPLIEDPFNKSSPSLGSSSEEDRAIAEKGFYLHPSPRTTTPRDSEPRLLPLFPVTSPRVSGSTSG